MKRKKKATTQTRLDALLGILDDGSRILGSNTNALLVRNMTSWGDFFNKAFVPLDHPRLHMGTSASASPDIEFEIWAILRAFADSDTKLSPDEWARAHGLYK